MTMATDQTLYKLRIVEVSYQNRLENEDGPGSLTNVISDSNERPHQRRSELSQGSFRHQPRPRHGLYNSRSRLKHYRETVTGSTREVLRHHWSGLAGSPSIQAKYGRNPFPQPSLKARSLHPPECRICRRNVLHDYCPRPAGLGHLTLPIAFITQICYYI